MRETPRNEINSCAEESSVTLDEAPCALKARYVIVPAIAIIAACAIFVVHTVNCKAGASPTRAECGIETPFGEGRSSPYYCSCPFSTCDVNDACASAGTCQCKSSTLYLILTLFGIALVIMIGEFILHRCREGSPDRNGWLKQELLARNEGEEMAELGNVSPRSPRGVRVKQAASPHSASKCPKGMNRVEWRDRQQQRYQEQLKCRPSGGPTGMDESLYKYLVMIKMVDHAGALVDAGYRTLEDLLNATSMEAFPASIPRDARHKLFHRAMYLSARRAAKKEGIDFRWRPLHHAAWQGKAAELRRIVSSVGIGDIDSQGPDGKTALHLAAGHGHRECVEALLDAGASPTIRDSKGRTAAEYAEQYGQIDLARSLRETELIAETVTRMKVDGSWEVAIPRAGAHTDRLYEMDGLTKVDSISQESFEPDDAEALRAKIGVLKVEQAALRAKVDPNARPRLLTLKKQIEDLERRLEFREQGLDTSPLPGVVQVESEPSEDDSEAEAAPKRPVLVEGAAQRTGYRNKRPPPLNPS
eukprot:Sspe_Gene.57170::Locus_31389_Transcript_1_1_Confidence_1.000_Length_1694::g.57170::m.57170